MPGDQASDKQLYQRLKKKDKDAFINAYDAYLEYIFRFLYFKVSSQEEAEDLSSQTFLKAWDYIQNNQLKDYKTLKSLLYKIARNLVIDHYRKKSRGQEVSIESSELLAEPSSQNKGIEHRLEIASEFEDISQKMLKIKDEYREAILLRYVNELSISEISTILGKSRGSIRVLLHRAITALKEVSQEDKKSE